MLSEFESLLLSVSDSLYACGVREIFGVAGEPITPLAKHAETRGIRYFGFRNEQAASYASAAIAFLTQRARTGVCMTVAGPGFTNALTGLANAGVNHWPNLLLCPLVSDTLAFQSMDQISCLKGICKGYFVYSKPDDDALVASALALANTAPFGSVCLFVSKKGVPINSCIPPISPPTFVSDIQLGEKTLVIIGGQVVLHPETFFLIRDLINDRRLPFLAESLARGILPESHPLCVSAARSSAFASCLSVVIIGGKIDWTLHFGSSPKWNPQCRFLILSDHPEYPPHLQARVSTASISSLAYIAKSFTKTTDSDWVNQLVEMSKTRKNLLSENVSPPNPNTLPSHVQAMGAIKRAVSRAGLEDALIVSEGANTMDVSRVVLDQIRLPCKRLDAGRWGTMGVGLAYVMAAHAIDPSCPTICIEGDSALGFSGMELETIVRYKCKAVIFVFNNGGIYTGARDNATAFNPNIRHDVLMNSFGGEALSTNGGDARTVETVSREAFLLLSRGIYPILVDIGIHPASGVLSGSISRL